MTKVTPKINKIPPILVQTWIINLKSNDQNVRDHAMKMLAGAFDNMQAVTDFVDRNNIKI